MNCQHALVHLAGWYDPPCNFVQATAAANRGSYFGGGSLVIAGIVPESSVATAGARFGRRS